MNILCIIILMSFERQIQEWVSVDNQLKQLNEKTRELRERRNGLEERLTTYASENNLSNATVQISDGKLRFANTKVQEPLTFKYLERTLSEVIKNESQVKLIMDNLKQKRSSKIVPEIKRFTNN
jgi:cell division septum initiation protein DivIVA